MRNILVFGMTALVSAAAAAQQEYKCEPTVTQYITQGISEDGRLVLSSAHRQKEHMPAMRGEPFDESVYPSLHFELRYINGQYELIDNHRNKNPQSKGRPVCTDAKYAIDCLDDSSGLPMTLFHFSKRMNYFTYHLAGGFVARPDFTRTPLASDQMAVGACHPITPDSPSP